MAISSMNLGRLEKVELRIAFQNEALDFTPWLAQCDNLKLLADSLELELECAGQEQGVGDFSADILCRNLVDGSWVLIENQLEKTDHSHLGQIITYATGLEAKTVIWIAQRFREEHRAAIDWLNEVTKDEIF